MITVIGKHTNQIVNSIVGNITSPLGDAGYEGEIYLGYPIFLDPISNDEIKIDILFVSKSGVAIVNYLENYSLDYSALQDRLYTKVSSKLGNYDFLVHKRKLFFDIHTITYSPFAVDKIDEYDIAFSEKELIECIMKRLDASFSDTEYSNILSGFQEAYGIGKRTIRPNVKTGTKAELVNNMEQIIERFDNHQMEAILSDPVGIQRIRGMAGSGKTVILAKKAVELHTKHPDWDIVVTFNTRSLKHQIETLIDKFYRYKNNGAKPNYKKLRVINAWGASHNKGLYYDICCQLECKYYTYTAAKEKFGMRNTFESVCAEVIKELVCPVKLYDCILIDEAQDFGPDFFKMCLKVLDDRKRLVYAYDELQNINDQTMSPPEELFGCSIQMDTPLKTTYRNQKSVIVAAHAIGMGLYSKYGLVQMPSAPDVWESIGYLCDSEIIKGHPVTLYRTKETSPDYLNANEDELLCVTGLNTREEMHAELARQIIDDLENQNLLNTDMMIIDMDTLGHEKNRVSFQTYLEQEGLDERFVTHLAGASSPEDFMRDDRFPPSVVYTSINRAKGNEAYQVYIINAQKSFLSISEMKERNSIFTAITRSKGWVSILGYGGKMNEIIDEVNAVKEHAYALYFSSYPTDDEIENLVLNHQDLAPNDQMTLDRARLLVDEVDVNVKRKMALEIFGVSSYEELIRILGGGDE